MKEKRDNLPFPMPREIRECGDCKSKCIGKFVDDELKDCNNFIPKHISAEEKWLRERFFGRGLI